MQRGRIDRITACVRCGSTVRVVVRGNGGHITRKDIFTCPHNRIVAETAPESDIEVEVLIGAILHNRRIGGQRHGDTRVNCNCHFDWSTTLVTQTDTVRRCHRVINRHRGFSTTTCEDAANVILVVFRSQTGTANASRGISRGPRIPGSRRDIAVDFILRCNDEQAFRTDDRARD